MELGIAQQPALFEPKRDDLHDPVFLEILDRHGFADRQSPVPLRGRYTKPRRWTSPELEWAYERWREGATFNEITATLNRNPQDIIFKLIDLCRERQEVFTEKGRNVGSAGWDDRIEACASELFANGLPAWKIALIFGVDFEHCEKRLYAGRADYGHKKKNPFAICTEHKHKLNIAVAKAILPSAERVFEGYAGEGHSTNGYLNALPSASVVAVENDADTANKLAAAVRDDDRAQVVLDTARRTLLRRILEEPNERFDLIDLDPFVSCADTIQPALELVRPGGLFFVTFGGEYRRCFIGTNRKSLARRYRVQLFEETNAEALEEMPRFMLGELASQALTFGLVIEPLVVVRYPMVIRAYLRIRKPKSVQALLDSFNASVTRDHRGSRFEVAIPKWRDVNAEDPLEATVEDRPHKPRRRR